MTTDLTQPVPRVVKLVVDRLCGHAYVGIWIGQESSPGKVGQLTMRREDWHDYVAAFKPEHITYLGDTEAWLNPPVIPPQPDAPALLVDGAVWIPHEYEPGRYFTGDSGESATWAGLCANAEGPIVPLVPLPERPERLAKPGFPFQIEDGDDDTITVKPMRAGAIAADVQSSPHLHLTAIQCRGLANALLWLAAEHDAKDGA